MILYQNVGRFQITMAHSFLVGMLHRRTNLDEQRQSVQYGQLVFNTIIRQRDTLHQFHHEKGFTRIGRSGVQDSSDMRMVHQGQGLALGFEARKDANGIHTSLDHFDRDSALDGLGLVGHEDSTHSSLADFLKKFVFPGQQFLDCFGGSRITRFIGSGNVRGVRRRVLPAGDRLSGHGDCLEARIVR